MVVCPPDAMDGRDHAINVVCKRSTRVMDFIRGGPEGPGEDYFSLRRGGADRRMYISFQVINSLLVPYQYL